MTHGHDEVEFTTPIRTGMFDVSPPTVALVVCKRCGAVVPILTLYFPIESGPDVPVDTRVLHADWHRVHDHGGGGHR
jgi:hypothetical protein